SVTLVVTKTFATITVAPDDVTLTYGNSVQLVATARDATGQPVENVLFDWTSSADTVAKVSATGVVAGTGVGTALITAAANGRTGHTNVTVHKN
ncbi:MAG TPA: Ig-like domain-containing protein, partial [Gemmatimonadaceae bacterium]|nr:Ig-like domain-containing protein [Gemmatimonadaceae bacterium]